jgi:hypothetical protein
MPIVCSPELTPTNVMRICPASVTMPDTIVFVFVIVRSGNPEGRNVETAVPVKMPFVAVPRLQRV